MRVKCAKCSTFGNPVYHEGIQGVKDCQTGSAVKLAERPSPPSQAEQLAGAGNARTARETPFDAGRYAVDIGDGTLRFFKVDKPTEGRWAGYVFVKEQASDEFYPVKGARKGVVLDAIAKDPKEAMLRYGREIGSCGHCGRTLTNEESREAGIGPICRGKVGW